MASSKRYRDEDLVRAVAASRSIAQVLAALGLRPAGGNYKTVQRRIKELGLETLHLKGQGWLGGTHVRTYQPKPLEQILVDNSYYKSFWLKSRLLKEGLKDQICEVCGIREWNGEVVPLELDHINGKNDDNRLSNLRIICPNCHAQTSTYRGKNKARVHAPVPQWERGSA